MRIEDVKQWQCGNGLAVAVNPCKQWERHPFNEKISYGAYDWKVFNQWASDPANQPVTDLEGIYNSEQVKEVWEYRGVLSDDWAQDRPTVYAMFPSFDAYSIYAKSLCAECETRRRLVLAEADKTESAVYGPGDDNYGRDNKIAALCNTDSSVKEAAIKTDKLYRPFWVEPAHLQTLGYELISDKDGYLKYQSSWKLKAMHRQGRTFEQLLGDGKRFIYFNCTYVPQDNLVFCCIREDGDSRTVYNGVLMQSEQLELILKLVE